MLAIVWLYFVAISFGKLCCVGFLYGRLAYVSFHQVNSGKVGWGEMM